MTSNESHDESAGRVPHRQATLILIAHGSHDPRWRASIEQLTESLQADLGRDRVRLAYMQCTPPTLMDAASEAVRAGATHLRLLPLFLTDQGHVTRHIHPLVDQLRQIYESVDVELLPPVGQHPSFRELLYKVAGQTAE